MDWREVLSGMVTDLHGSGEAAVPKCLAFAKQFIGQAAPDPGKRFWRLASQLEACLIIGERIVMTNRVEANRVVCR
jgi:hypothetical protein